MAEAFQNDAFATTTFEAIVNTSGAGQADGIASALGLPPSVGQADGIATVAGTSPLPIGVGQADGIASVVASSVSRTGAALMVGI